LTLVKRFKGDDPLKQPINRRPARDIDRPAETLRESPCIPLNRVEFGTDSGVSRSVKQV
jgi:hypothetical protein